MCAPLGKVAVSGTCTFLELDNSMIGQDDDDLDFFSAHLPAEKPTATRFDELPYK
jgi:hypothetical protein